jgi:anti-sigma regulatory factor (Ser/Thr protein kinase)
MFAAATAEVLGLDSAEIETIVGELAANAYVHARSAFTVSLSCVDSLLQTQVKDQSSLMPVLASGVLPDVPQGRGLMIVGAIAETWGAMPTPFGKIVWAELSAKVPAK